MTTSSDTMNCLKNLMRLMCCDGAIQPAEKSFLSRAAKELGVQVDNWNELLNEVLRDSVLFYPIQDREKAVATLKSMIVMSRVDGEVNPREKAMALQFAKAIGVDKAQWQQILKDIDLEHLFVPFTETRGSVVAIADDFEKLDAFVKVAADNGAEIRTVGLRPFLDGANGAGDVVCFHAAEDKDATLKRCRMLMDKCGENVVCILTRFQGHQVKYLHEIGLKKCIIEPAYAKDIADLFKGS